jgi:peroxiredoxin
MPLLLPTLALGTALHLLAGPAALPPTAPPVTRFGGHLDHAPAGDTVRLWVGPRQVKAPLGPSGDFQFELKDLRALTPVHFTYAGQHTRLYLLPGDQLRLALDFKEFDKSLTYSGRGADINNYMAQAQWKFEYGPPGNEPRPMDQLTPATTPADMRRHADAFRQQRLAFLAAYAQAHPLPAAFRHDAALFIDVSWGMQLLQYVNYYRQQKNADGSPRPVMPEAYFSFLKEIPLREVGEHLGRGLDESTAVGWFLQAYQERLAPTGQLSTDPADGPRLYRLATAELGDTKARDLVMQLLMFWKLDHDLPGVLAFYPTFRAHNRDSTVARDLRVAITKHLALGEGQPAPNFTLVDNTGKKVSLSDFRGKVVYLDFWGTWCAPCLREMAEFAPALKKQFEGRDVVFLYISVNDPEAKWQQTLASQHFTSPNSVHLRSATDAEASAYQVTGYPSYFLIGRDGRFIKLYTNRPSDGAATVAALEAALKG